MNRKPVASPEYYPNTFTALDNSIQESFTNDKGPGTLQSARRNVDTELIIFPKDKIDLCGPCMAWGYKEVAESSFPKAYLILGANTQSEVKYSTYLFANWETPFGIVHANQELGKALIKTFPKVLNEHTAHQTEHSIEVQLPWLQFASRDKLLDLSIIPFLTKLTSLEEIRELAEILDKFTKEHKVNIIVSANIEDTATIQYIRSSDQQGLFDYKKRKRKTVEEIAPIILLMEIAKLRNKEAKVINYQLSTKEKRTYYATIAFR